MMLRPVLQMADLYIIQLVAQNIDFNKSILCVFKWNLNDILASDGSSINKLILY